MNELILRVNNLCNKITDFCFILYFCLFINSLVIVCSNLFLFSF